MTSTLTAVVGQGSDEIFGGYPLFLPDYLSEADATIHDLTMSDESRKVAYTKVMSALQMQGPDNSQENPSVVPALATQAQMSKAYPPLPFKSEIMKHIQSTTQPPYMHAISDDILTKMKTWHPFHSGQYIFSKAHLDKMILCNLGDRGEMAHSIEGRTPFLDHHLTEYANSLPPSMKIRPRLKQTNHLTNGTSTAPEYEFIEKYVLREAARPFVTDEIYNKRKHPYSAPLKYGIGGPLHRLMTKLVTRENVAELGFLDWNGCEGGLGALVNWAFEEGDEKAFRLVICIAQWVVIGQRFEVRQWRGEMAKW